MFHKYLIKRCLLVAICFLSIQTDFCLAEYPMGAIQRESEIQDRFYLGQIPADNLSELRIVRFSDSFERPPREWKDVQESEQMVITDQVLIAKIFERLNSEEAPENAQAEHKESPCAAIGAFVGQLRNPKGEWVVSYFHVHDNYLQFESPSGMSSGAEREVWEYLRVKYPELLRPTKGAELSAIADAQQTNVRRVYYNDGSLRTEFPLVDGNYNGVAKSYYKSGRLALTLPYTDGKLNGVVKSYPEDGTSFREASHVNGKRHGVERDFDENGNLVETWWWWQDKSVPEEEFKRLQAQQTR